MRYLFILCLLLLTSFVFYGQEGLEGIILEKYYVSVPYDGKDSINSGSLPEGSITYRIFVDLLPGYRFQAAYGTAEAPLLIQSTAPFFNHMGSGQTHPNIIPERTLRKNVVLLDSWLSVGAAGENHYGIPKIYDPNGQDSLLMLPAGFFQGKSKKNISPLTQDGMIRADSLPFPNFFKIDSALYHLGSTTNSNEIKIVNGAWASLGKGTFGADSLTTNTVLIAQLTTAGELSYRLNLMIGTPSGKSIKYTYNAGSNGVLHHESLLFESGQKKHKKHKKKNKKKR